MMIDYIKFLISSNDAHSLLLHSKTGLGKTYTTIKTLKKLNVEYAYTNGVITTVALYKMLYENNNKVIIIDDVETIFQDDRTVNLLKAALWDVDGIRQVTYKTSSKTLEGYPEQFEFTGKIIILANDIIGKNNLSFQALLSRCIKYEIQYSYNEIKEIAKDIVKNKTLTTDIKNKVVDVIDNSITPQHFFNFRLLDRLISFLKYDINKGENLFFNSIDKDEDLDMFLNIINNNKSVTEQINKYIEQTGKSRMTFFRKKKKLIKEGIICYQ
jgi:hypothetical protein